MHVDPSMAVCIGNGLSGDRRPSRIDIARVDVASRRSHPPARRSTTQCSCSPLRRKDAARLEVASGGWFVSALIAGCTLGNRLATTVDGRLAGRFAH
jgi:hypothetical protein